MADQLNARPATRAPASHRLWAGAVALCCLGVLIIGSVLEPSESGAGTHRQLGLPPCGMLLATGVPCPSCGMTTAVTLASHGEFARSFATQPFGFFFALAAAVGFWGGAHSAVFGARVAPLAGKLLRPWMAWPAAGLWGIAWLYKVVVWPG